MPTSQAARPEAHQPDALDAWNSPMRWPRCCRPTRPAGLRGELSELGVRVIRVGTLFERMSYDQDVIAVRAGKPVEFVFENSDLMPHNFVIVRPGALEELALAAEATAQQPGRRPATATCPQSPTRCCWPARCCSRATVEKLSFTAPTEPGVYPYVCTYPGHWRRMYGALYVVDDLDAYLENPESYLAAHPLEIKDELLKDRRPRTEWKFDDLAAAVGELKDGRSLWQRQADVPGGQLRGLPQAGRRRQRHRPRPGEARRQVPAARHPQGTARSLGPDQREVPVVSSSSSTPARS